MKLFRVILTNGEEDSAIQGTPMHPKSLENWITLHCVPGPKGVQGNKEVDILAKRGSTSEFIGPEPIVGIPMCLAKIVINKYFKKKT